MTKKCVFPVWSAGFVILLIAIFPAASGSVATVYAAERTFHVRYSKEIHDKPFTGRVYVFFSRTRWEPRTKLNWFNPELFLAMDVENWMPGERLTFSGSQAGKMLAYPKPLADMKLTGYRAQAVVRFEPHERQLGTGAGNGYSRAIPVGQARTATSAPVFVVDQLVSPKKFRQTKRIKLLRIRSKLLSDFHHRDVFLQAAVVLPAQYDNDPDRRYPTIFRIPGFSGTHFEAFRLKTVSANAAAAVKFLNVVLDPSCSRGHHVFADSANNGPVGTALVTELIPAFNSNFRSIDASTARFLTGHSSGGWSSLWLQVAYPDYFGGTWSTAPDPVDFRDFQRINLYRPGENMYVDSNRKPRPLARGGGRVLLWFRGFADMEETLGYGGQLHSFEAVFSPRGKDGKPQLIWDRKTGTVNTAVSRTWQEYDIRLILERNWKTLGPKLKGKLHVFMGAQDTFYLEGATVLLKQSLANLNSDAVVEIHPGKDHASLMTWRLRARIRREMVEALLSKHRVSNRENRVSP
jgi:hypothetical protein